jgi:hypothetical protein
LTPRYPGRTLEGQGRKGDDTHAVSIDASLTLRDILLKVGEAGADGANGTFDFDLLGKSYHILLAYLSILVPPI